MALKLNDRVKETSTTTGTGTLDLSGAVTAFETFVAGIGDGNTTYYAIVNRDEDEWETGLGTVTDASTDTLSRSAISSSNSDSAVDFSAGTKDVFTTLPASKAVYEDASSDVTLPDDLILGSDSAVLKFGADSDTTLTHTDGTGLTLNTTNKLLFRDSALYINSSADGQLDIVADTEVQIAATTIDINGAVALNGAITGATDITLSGELDAATLDISGNADIDGTSNLDAVDIDGAVQIDATFTSGVDGQGYDVKFFGDTASAYMLWDTSADDLILAGGAGFVIPDAGNIGSASDTDAIAISSAGVVALSATTAASATTTAALTVAGGLGVAGDIWVGDDLTLDSDSAVLSFGDDQDITMTHVADTGVTIGGSHANGTNVQITNSAGDGDSVVQFALGGTVQYSMGVEDGDSDKFVINYGTGALGAQPALEISSAGAVTVPGNLTVSGTLAGAASAGFAVAMAIAL